MRKLDDVLRNWRAGKALAHIRPGGRLLDVGCFDGYLVRQARSRVAEVIGLDPLIASGEVDGIEFIRDSFPPRTEFADGSFDCISMLAVLEHMTDPDAVAAECRRLLKPGGQVVLTVPSPWVDPIIWVLQRLRLLDGVCTEQHHGFDVEQTGPIFERAGFVLERREKFQLGLNNVFVFKKPRIRSPRIAVPAQQTTVQELECVPALG
ncbi:MAG TPA: class I SAM-dependent methyltransferase [Phycisphaerae bacterium]|nr:class I SAM-dependent methyltransferase [Phycisphaerae bacterium]HOJ72337.1 class I SAM-dependent methyltransferase [Phycisphaerae bacterium]HOM50001.1 class I SAM-dependent methyltransferase [Phycisphaerae bacterium]HOQ84751.1 class I SAM-dependent methyltransferase [Phycisphaerae bacterium]HPP26429.1 class I SAM-dependent methyltransferase [Phycisphaerae bacterium]